MIKIITGIRRCGKIFLLFVLFKKYLLESGVDSDHIKDVVERNKIQNVDQIGTLVDILASAIGTPTNPTKISNTFIRRL